MKKIFLYILAGSLCFTACKKDDEVSTYVEPEDITTQNTYDDQAIKKFMDENYLDAQGNIKAFSSTDTSDDNEKKLSELNPVTLPSGTIYIMRTGAQPSPADEQVIGSTDIIKVMMKATTYLAINSDGKSSFTAATDFMNTINGTGIPAVDPKFYYTAPNDPLITNATTDAAKKQSYYMIEGFSEALQKFKAFNNYSSSEPYNLQGVIIVPSRAAFARDPYFPYNYPGYSQVISLRNKTFVFNFQVYNRATRP
ncbi:hypothetical protein [Chryseobacterium culicis]|jgi:hypothetical protein|uniref:Uncharacterized protein n=1 Tax=Chryseobacterium culicis TaxID=680127 RepID=A0A1H6HW03_CHRCI|nr:hypothetical protein [Chryseobacterium culicis]MBE4950835.1 hypothetical protein [Chryseobacterium culicis]SEH40199.1 hypothetical protein SAMN05421593_3743 [Chryseobacterium culicis]